MDNILTRDDYNKLNDKIDSLIELLQRNSSPRSDDLLSTKQAAKYLGVSIHSIHRYKAKASGALRFCRVGRSIKFRKIDLIDFTNGKIGE